MLCHWPAIFLRAISLAWRKQVGFPVSSAERAGFLMELVLVMEGEAVMYSVEAFASASAAVRSFANPNVT